MHIYNTYVSTACTFTVVYLLHLLTFCKNVNINHTGSREKNLIKYICRPQSILFCLDFVIFFFNVLSFWVVMENKIQFKNSSEDLEHVDIVTGKGRTIGQELKNNIIN